MFTKRWKMRGKVPNTKNARSPGIPVDVNKNERIKKLVAKMQKAKEKLRD